MKKQEIIDITGELKTSYKKLVKILSDNHFKYLSEEFNLQD